MKCRWCDGLAKVLVIAGCLESHIFEVPLCTRCETHIRFAYCPDCGRTVDTALTVSLDDVNRHVV
jgi:predicted amidophosphoribosyltransferase